jgi:heat shock protein HslJ
MEQKGASKLKIKSLLLALTLLGGFVLSSCDSVTEPSAVFEAQGTWQLRSFELDDGSTIQVPNPEKYTIQFDGQESVNARADCNLCNGRYENKFGNDLEISLLACTLAYCGPSSLDFRYTSAVTSTSSYRREGDELFLNYDGGTMNFSVNP